MGHLMKILIVLVLFTSCSSEVTKLTDCGANIASGEWATFMCHNLGSANTSADPFTPSWEIIGGYWQWGRSVRAAEGPSGPFFEDSNSGAINGWFQDLIPSGALNSNFKTTNDPCPNGFRIPTYLEWEGLLLYNDITFIGTWSSAVGEINYTSGIKVGEKLFLPAGGFRGYSGELHFRGTSGNYWSSTEDGNGLAKSLYFRSSYSYTESNTAGLLGYSVRCIEE